MPLQNRVLPTGEIVASTARGTMMGNRGGCFHNADRALKARRWATRQWICCVLEFKGRRRAVMSPGLYTELFFLDEATALAAGHRPCFECRRASAELFASLWHAALASTRRARAPDMDRTLHAERIDGLGGKRLHQRDGATVPDGAMIALAGAPWLVAGGRLLQWTLEGYQASQRRVPSGRVDVITPPSIVTVLERGYRPSLHPTAMNPPRRHADHIDPD